MTGGKVTDMTVEELKEIIDSSVRESFEELMEDIAALASPAYLDSIREARRDYECGDVVSLDEVARG